MTVPTTAADLSTTASSNSPAGTDAIGTSLDDYLRSIQAIMKQEDSAGVDIASASAITIPSAGKYFTVTGTTAITSIVDSWTGRTVELEFSGILTFTHSAGLILPGAANITTAAGDVAIMVNESTGVWRCVNWLKSALVPGNASTVGGLTTAQLTTLTTAQVNALTTAQVLSINVERVGGLTTAQLSTLTTTQVNALTTAQILTINVQAVGALTTSQIAVLGGPLGTPSSGSLVNCTGAPAPTAAQGSSMVLLSSVSASNSATVDVETTFDATYDSYLLVGVGITAQTASQSFLIRTKIGGSYDTGSNYLYTVNRTAAGDASPVCTSNTADTALLMINGASVTGAAASMNFTMSINEPSSTTLQKSIYWNGTYTMIGNTRNIVGSGNNSGTAALTGMRFFFGSGNIVAGNFYLYGLKKA